MQCATTRIVVYPLNLYLRKVNKLGICKLKERKTSTSMTYPHPLDKQNKVHVGQLSTRV